MDTDDLRRQVEQVGGLFDFGEYELAAYLAVLEHGQLTPSEITERTDIPQTRVYDTVRDLESRGVVVIKETRPMRVVAVDPEEAFGSAREAFGDVLDELETRYSTPALSVEAVSLVKSRNSILRYLEAVVESAEYELSLSLTPDLLARFEADLRERNAEVNVNLLVAPAADAPDSGEYDYTAVATMTRARRGVTTPVIAVADGEFSVYATRQALTGEGRYGVIFNQSTLGFLVNTFFNNMLWTTADEVATAPDGRAFPRRYASIRQCIREILANDGPFRATVEGRDVTTGTPRQFTGPVADTTFEMGGGIASLTVDTDDGPVTVGGRVAALEDVEAHEVVLERASG